MTAGRLQHLGERHLGAAAQTSADPLGLRAAAFPSPPRPPFLRPAKVPPPPKRPGPGARRLKLCEREHPIKP